MTKQRNDSAEKEKTKNGKVEKKWVETNPSNIRIFPMDIHFLPPPGTLLKTLIKVLIQMFPDVRKVGFHPPIEKFEKEQEGKNY